MTRILIVFLFACVATALGGSGPYGPPRHAKQNVLEERMLATGRRCYCEPVWTSPYAIYRNGGADSLDEDYDVDPRLLHLTVSRQLQRLLTKTIDLSGPGHVYLLDMLDQHNN